MAGLNVTGGREQARRTILHYNKRPQRKLYDDCRTFSSGPTVIVEYAVSG
jgi:hypothetical protein